ncbi:hypothetical protein [Paraliomyxa miuraensis]|uniref:hypothetical protein n=1 Tax=Paraliomyxa miuraensis TaxID=376150 RepID=UPI00225B0FAB|nr:hypothetical protein [Paraliomyxa miuraensis]MCX4247304.1 hypothetical protein [Paraliomyxa miuraensis]
MLRSLARVALSLVLGASLVLPTASASTPRERSQTLLAEGDTAYASDRLDDAISKYRASYYSLEPDDQADYLGSLPLRKAMRAFSQLVDAEQDPARRRALRQRQRVMLEEFLDAVSRKPGAAENVGEDVIGELEELRRSIEQELAGPTTPVDPAAAGTSDEAATQSQPTSGTSTHDEQSSQDPAQRSGARPDRTGSRDWLGLGLVIGGGTTLAAGVGVTIGYFTIRRGALETVDGGGPEFADGTQARTEYLDDEYARAKNFLIAGSVVGGVGLAVAIGGAVRLAVHRRRSSSAATAMQLSPMLTPTTAGLAVHRRF